MIMTEIKAAEKEIATQRHKAYDPGQTSSLTGTSQRTVRKWDFPFVLPLT